MPYKSDAGKDRGIAFLKHPNIKSNKETIMGKILRMIVSQFGRTSSFERDMLTYAKPEYKDDWHYAYHYMLSHGGKGPQIRGVTQ